jgi:hypothetical protein
VAVFGRWTSGRLLVLGAPGTTLCQSTTGTLAGTVSDETGGVLPDVTVGLAGDHVAGGRTALTDGRGRYRFVDSSREATS